MKINIFILFYLCILFETHGIKNGIGEQNVSNWLYHLKPIVENSPNNKSIIFYKETSEISFPANENLGLIQNHKNLNLLPSLNRCGFSNNSEDFSRNQRIIGGHSAEFGAYPWMALIGFSNKSAEFYENYYVQFGCGGTLINSRYILTASHCIRGLPPGLNASIVRLGEYDKSTDPDCDFSTGICAPKFQDISIEEIILHENYNKTFIRENDIALLRLSQNVNFSDFVRPICLPMGYSINDITDSKINKKLTINGWGKLSYNDSKASEILQEVQVPIVSNKACDAYYLEIFGKIDYSRRFCAGGENGIDSCTGDSGGPMIGSLLINEINQFRIFQFGIISHGPLKCGAKGELALYTKVSFYIPWILDHIRT